MICPSCGARVSDGTLVCPRCHEPLGVTQKISLGDASWCPDCGALVPRGAEACPKCGCDIHARAAAESVRRTRELDLPSIGDTGVIPAEDQDLTNVMTRIESAIPDADDASTPSARSDRMPRTRTFVLAALLGIVVVGGAALLITHPWDPDATSISATTPADTSMAGFPGLLEYLTGQDSSSDDETLTAAEQIAQEMDEYYEELGEISELLDESEEDLEVTGVSGDADARAAALEDVEAIAIDLSNLISTMSDTYDDTSSWADEMGDLITLGNWLRNRCDALVDAWELSAESEDPAAASDEILAEAAAGDAYRTLFKQYYESWDPSGE